MNDHIKMRQVASKMIANVIQYLLADDTAHLQILIDSATMMCNTFYKLLACNLQCSTFTKFPDLLAECLVRLEMLVLTVSAAVSYTLAP